MAEAVVDLPSDLVEAGVFGFPGAVFAGGGLELREPVPHGPFRVAVEHGTRPPAVLLPLGELVRGQRELCPRNPRPGDLIQPGTLVASSEGREAWLGLMSDSDLQANCNEEGLNSEGSTGNANHAVRIGITGNNEDSCTSNDSRLGIGGRGTNCGATNSPVGNFVGCNGNNFNHVAFGWVFIR